MPLIRIHQFNLLQILELKPIKQHKIDIINAIIDVQGQNNSFIFVFIDFWRFNVVYSMGSLLAFILHSVELVTFK